MNIGIKGTDHNSRTCWIYFERVPGSREPMVRIRTESEVIYIKEESFIRMFGKLFAGTQEYEPRHGRTGEKE